jgi:hypothetical protein
MARVARQRIMWRSAAACVACVACMATTAYGAKAPPEAEPQRTYSAPSAARPGEATEVAFFGAAGGKGVGLWTNFAGRAAPMDSQEGNARFRLTLPADVPVGIGAVRVATAGGLSSAQFFLVDDLPTVGRSGGNLSPAEAKEVGTLGAIDGAAEALAAHYYRFEAKRGQRVAFEVVAQRLGSKMDPLVRVLDSGGGEVAYCDDTPGLGADCRFAHTFAADGAYLVEVRDANYEGSAAHRYRLRVGDFPCVTAAFPTAVTRGVAQTVSVEGANERIEGVPVTVPAGAARWPVAVRYPGGKSSAFVSVLGAERADQVAKETSSAERIELPIAISGRFERAATHAYEFAGKKGQRVLVRGRTRSVGSPCDLYLQLFKVGGGRVAESKPPGADEGSLEAALPEEGTYRLSVENISRATGLGMVYRLEVEPAAADFALSVETEKVEAVAGRAFRLKVKCARKGYDGPIALSLAGDGVGFELGGATIPAGKAEADVEVTCPEGAVRGRPLSFSVVGRAKVGDGEVVRRASTATALKKLFPRMINTVPEELDGEIGLLVKAGEKRAATRPATTRALK